LKEECRLIVFENRVPRKIFGPKRDEIRGEWRKLLNGEWSLLLANYYSSDKSRRMRWAGRVTRMG
jgi:hypothetical protein